MVDMLMQKPISSTGSLESPSGTSQGLVPMGTEIVGFSHLLCGIDYLLKSEDASHVVQTCIYNIGVFKLRLSL